jgi:hypothetical protein
MGLRRKAEGVSLRGVFAGVLLGERRSLEGGKDETHLEELMRGPGWRHHFRD